MKTKYIIYSLLIIGIVAFIAYRIIHNRKENQAGQTSGGPKTATVTGVIATS